MRLTRQIALLGATAALALTIGGPVLAQSSGAVDRISSGLDRAAKGYGAKYEPGKLPDLVGGVISGLLSISGVLLLCYILYGGFIWMTAQGDKGKVTTAIAIIRNAIIGIAIVGMSNVIASYVISKLSEAYSGGTQTQTSASP